VSRNVTAKGCECALPKIKKSFLSKASRLMEGGLSELDGI
jgi:hypothetical protein